MTNKHVVRAAARSLAAVLLFALAMVAGAALLAVSATAQAPALTTITDTLYGASGSITIVANSTFTTADGYVVPKGYEPAPVQITDGTLSIALPPNVGSIPAGSSYTAYYNVTPGGQFSEVWVVPSSAQPVKLAAVRTSPAPSPGITFAFAQLNAPTNCIDLGGLVLDTSDGWTCTTAAGTGTVTSVGLSLPSWLTATGSPVTTSGTLAVTAASGQTAHEFLGTGTGASFGPVAITRADLPAITANDLPGSYIAPFATALAAAPSLCASGHYPLGVDAQGNALDCTTASGEGGTGTVTSVGLTAPAWLSVTGSPVSGAGTLGLSAATGQPANEFLATPNGSAGAAALRAIVAADLPATISSDTSGNAGTASALKAVPAQCSGGDFSTGIAVDGTANCGQVTYAQLGGAVPTWNQSTTGNSATATALSATPTQCSAGEAAGGIAANGNAQGCFTPSGGSGAGITKRGEYAASDQLTASGTFATTWTIPANTLSAGSIVRLDLYGQYTYASGNTFKIGFSVGGAVAIAPIGAFSNAFTAAAWNERAVCVVATAGTSGTMICNGQMHTDYFNSPASNNSTTFAVDTTSALTVTVQATLTSGATSANLYEFAGEVF